MSETVPITCGCGKRVSPRLASCPYCRADLRSSDGRAPSVGTPSAPPLADLAPAAVAPLALHGEPCANQDGPMFARCIRCRLPFCDRCAAFMVNGKPWCEPCGTAAIDDAKLPRWRIVLAVLVALLFVLFSLVMFAGGRLRAVVGGMVVAVVAPIFILNPIGAADRPRIERRHPAA